MAREVASASAEGGRVSAGDLGERLLDNHVDNAAVFRVHADEAIVLCCLAHGLEDRGVIEHEDARVSHEELEAGDPFADELAHFLELRGAEIGDDGADLVAGDADVGEERVRCGDDCAVADYRIKTHLRSSGILFNLHRRGPPTPLFFVSADSKALSIPVSPLE